MNTEVSRHYGDHSHLATALSDYALQQHSLHQAPVQDALGSLQQVEAQVDELLARVEQLDSETRVLAKEVGV